jgi:hypothetical protein
MQWMIKHVQMCCAFLVAALSAATVASIFLLCYLATAQNRLTVTLGAYPLSLHDTLETTRSSVSAVTDKYTQTHHTGVHATQLVPARRTFTRAGWFPHTSDMLGHRHPAH